MCIRIEQVKFFLKIYLRSDRKSCVLKVFSEVLDGSGTGPRRSGTIGGEDNEGYSCIQRINTFESTRAYQLNVYRIHSQTQHYSQLKQFAEQLIMPVSHYTD